MKKILYAVLILFLLSFNAYAVSPDYLSEEEQAVLDEINLVRTNPAQYAQNYLVPLKNIYKDKRLLETLNECVTELNNTAPMGTLEPSKGLSQAAADHVNDQGPTGKIGHGGNDGSSPWDRMDRYGSHDGTSGENISYGYNKARSIVIDLLIDHDVPSRGHRKNILAKSYHYLGIAIGKHSEYTSMCVMDFAEKYTESVAANSSTVISAITTEPDINTSSNDICSTTLTNNEKRLYDLIMEYRKSQGLPAIPLSPSLTFVAQTHARDLAEHPPASNCNGHSWSTYGNWSSCCYTPDHAQAKCMWDKPRELTDYKGSGFEISVGGSGYNSTITPEMALSVWKKSPGHNAVIVNSGTWKNSEWKAIGIGLYGSRGVVWFGKVTDVCHGK